MKLWKEELLVDMFKITEGIFHNCCQNKDIVDFQNLQDKLKSMTLN